MSYLLLIINVFLMASGQLLFKRSADFINHNPTMPFPMNYVTNTWFYAAVLIFGISTVVWTQVLTKIPLSIAYPITSFSYLLTLLGALVIFHEQLEPSSIIGVVIIMVGIAVITLK
ncbi:MAG TPA: EamA family transporter [Candidatus Saccharimonadales bacterium]|nr:EamA family transporter [Candidatus Saccharimonadales bacterium]